MATRRAELTRQAARLFAEKGYHGTSMGDLAEAMGVQKGSLYAHTDSKQDLLYQAMREGADAFHAALDPIPEDVPPGEKIPLPLPWHPPFLAPQLPAPSGVAAECPCHASRGGSPTSARPTR